MKLPLALIQPLVSRKTILLAIVFFALANSAKVLAQSHLYDLNGSYTDAFGGPSLVPNGGTLNATNYTFAPNQGLSLSNALPNTGNYSILADFQFSDLSSYRKIIDFQNRASDTGLYNLNTALNFYNITTGGANAFSPNVLARLVLTRDSATQQVNGYVNGVLQLSFIDSSNLGVFAGPNGIINFFIDDTGTSGEASAGLVDRIAIYNSALSATDVRLLGGPAPIPGPGNRVPEGGSTLALLSLVLAALGMLRRPVLASVSR